ncbi:MAG: hypothetical protein JSU66_10660 [Deltaproteobacteria bacterium]|nr:MAG: hypothetical protein JSU66_10660 [Deltaproteobacteria bacterium]
MTRITRALLAGALACAGCSASAPDRVTERCIAALHYWMSPDGTPDVLAVEPEPRHRLRSIRYASGGALRRSKPGRITCQHDPDDPWTFTRIRIGDRELSAVEVSLVNGELFLRDLVENPERLRRP